MAGCSHEVLGSGRLVQTVDGRNAGGFCVAIIAGALVLLGYAVALPVLRWHRRDLHSFRRSLWAGYGSRQARLRGAVVCYLAFGWPEVLMALGWRSSQTRGALVIERDEMREARAQHLPEDNAR